MTHALFRPALRLLLLATALAAVSLPVQASPQIANQAGCAVCHAANGKMIGPSWHDIAAKYKAHKGQPPAATLLAERVRQGSVGVWGKLPMPPTPTAKLSDADLKAVIAWVLKTP